MQQSLTTNLFRMRVACCTAELRDDEAQESEVAQAGLTSGQVKLLSRGTIQYKDIMQMVGAGPVLDTAASCKQHRYVPAT
jgi:hypothetical protein